MGDPGPNNNKGKSSSSKGSWKNNRAYFWNKNRNYSNASLPSCNVENEESRYIDDSSGSCPFKSWKYYFHDEEYKPNSDTVKKVKSIYSYVEKQTQAIVESQTEFKKFFTFDYKALAQSAELKLNWPNFVDDLTENPAHSLNCMGLALNQLVRDEGSIEAPSTIIRARLSCFDSIIPIKSLKSCLYGKLVGVRGTVVRVSPAKVVASRLAFSCFGCSTIQSVCQPAGVYKPPTRCPKRDCSARTFSPLVSSRYTSTRSCQTIKLQENIDDDRDGGRVPRNVECELMDDLIDSCGPGDCVTVVGIVKVDNAEGNKKTKASPNVFTLFLEGVSVVNSKGKASSGRNQAVAGVEFSLKDYYAIQEIHGEKHLMRLLVNSVCPSVYGHEMVKAGLVLALVGGAGAGGAVANGSTPGAHTRGDPHVLVVGDPGLGKSHMLHAVASIAPRGVYVCGNTTSTSGLTVTLSKESGGDYALEAGALVLADRGTCCIDEFDKMTNQHQALLQAMEQQNISIAKGGVVCTLPARTSVIAAANPAGGHYNKNKTVAENLKMGQPLLSRFDLVFILLDKPNQHLDSLLSEHVMALHCGAQSRGNSSFQSAGSHSASFAHSQLHSAHPDQPSAPLSERLKIPPGEYVDLIPAALLRKYIAYVRKYVPWPQLSPGAASILQQFYLELRKQYQGRQSTPVTTRQLESMLRLTQARAKAELREEAVESDARDVVELMKWSMLDTYSDGSGHINFSRSQNGSGMSGGSKVKRFISALNTRASLDGKTVFSTSDLKDLVSVLGLNLPDFHSFISTLNTQGFLLKKGPNSYKLLSA